MLGVRDHSGSTVGFWKGSFSMLYTTDSSFCPHMVKGKMGKHISSWSCKGANLIHEGSTLMTSSWPNYLLKSIFPPKVSALWIRCQYMNLGRHKYLVHAIFNKLIYVYTCVCLHVGLCRVRDVYCVFKVQGKKSKEWKYIIKILNYDETLIFYKKFMNYFHQVAFMM
jgi:hypothetical protein